jgi:hypothetical protein
LAICKVSLWVVCQNGQEQRLSAQLNHGSAIG